MDSSSSAAWYAQLSKPFFAPPAGVFGPVWTVLYVIIAVSFGFVLLQYLRRRLPFRVLLPFILNLLANLAYTPIQFGLKNNALASSTSCWCWARWSGPWRLSGSVRAGWCGSTFPTCCGCCLRRCCNSASPG